MGRELHRVIPDAEFGEQMAEGSTPVKGDWWQMWQTVSDKAYTPAFATPEELARWCAEHPWGAEVDNPVSYDRWLAFIIGPGWAPTMTRYAGEGVMTSVEFVTRDVVPNAI